MSPWQPPNRFDEYVLVKPLGRGQMGQVYVAFDTVLARHVAVKFISTLDPGSSQRQRFLVEARAAARLQHPNVLTVFRVGELGGQPYIVTELVRGQPLDVVPKPLTWERVLQIAIGLSRGLAAAHREGVLHRDIKPSNAILADDGRPMLLDFGLAKLLPEEGDRARGPDGGAAGSPGPAELSAPGTDVTRPSSSSGVRPETWMRDATAPLAQTTSPPGAPAAELDRNLTAVGTVMGTPDYMAPEIWAGSAATPRSDVYSLGALLYELCVGDPPHAEVEEDGLAEAVQGRQAAPVAARAPSVDPRLAAIVDRCLQREPSTRFRTADKLREALEQLAREATGLSLPEGNPYRGLQPFDAQHRALFFGRTDETGIIIDRLRTEAMLVVAGDSGVGKSSVCRAGVLPQVEEGALEAGRRWSVISMVPGPSPLAALAHALGPLLESSSGDFSVLARDAPGELVHKLGARLRDHLGLVIFVDQLEELVTVSDPEQARVVEDVLGRLAYGLPGLRLLATLRADLLTRIAALPNLGSVVARALYLLPPLSPQRVREVIVGPAHAKGIDFESEELVESLVASTSRSDGGLPLLQFALAELWDARDPERALITSYALRSIGGVAGALSRHADRVVAGLPRAERVAARRILTALVTTHGTRCRRSEDELTGGESRARRALGALVQGRLVTAQDDAEGAAYELAHEILIQGWATLHGWLQADAEHRAVRERLHQAAAEWERLGCSNEALWSRRQLAEASGVGLGGLGPREVAFFGASQRAARRRALLRYGLAVAIPLLLGAAFLTVRLQASVDENRRIAVQVQTARAALNRARASLGHAERLERQAFADFRSGKRRQGLESWSQSQRQIDATKQQYVVAAQALEVALAVDHTRPDVRAFFAEVLYERTLLAERTRQKDQRTELAQRLRLYDDQGKLTSRLSEPGRLAITTDPPGATVRLQRYGEDTEGKLRLSVARFLGRTPLEDLALSPGSYLFTFNAPGRTAVRYPVLLHRGERLQVRIRLPNGSQVPAGMIYIPPGRFLFGSASRDLQQLRYLDTLPLHERRTAGYLIGGTEVTFARWIDFLRSLPPAERARRSPNVAHVGFAGALRLEEKRRDRWVFTFQPAGHRYRARMDEPIRYRARKMRVVQRWLRLPVTGIGAEDAEAYTSWLRSTGRVPGARLCTELEWERAARGADARSFPHGNTLDPQDANYDETYGKAPGGMGPDEVGSHPRSQSPFGVQDMAGNAFEWVTPSVGDGAHTARGGSYFYDAFSAGVANRQTPVAGYRDATLGFRVCASFPLR